MIKLQIIGNLGKDCNVREVNGKKVINFSVAHTDRYKDAAGNPKERTTWVECSYWTDRVAVADYLTRGRTVYAEGAPEADAYTNREGQPAATLRMRVATVQLLGNQAENPGQSGATGNNVSHMGHTTAPVMRTSEAQPEAVSQMVSEASQPMQVSDGAEDLPF